MGKPDGYIDIPISAALKRLADAHGLPLAAGSSNPYGHIPYCNGDHSKPKGGPMCCCLNSLKQRNEGIYI